MTKRDLKEATTAPEAHPPRSDLPEAAVARGLAEATACVRTHDGTVVCGVLVGGPGLDAPSSAATPPAPASSDGTVKGNE
jgi:hypothetical protein